MQPQTKIATCCYCGTRAALVLRGKDRHELACSACGAPLHDLKAMPVPAKPARVNEPKKQRSYTKPSKSKKKPKKSKRKSRMTGFFEEAFDFIEDIFD